MRKRAANKRYDFRPSKKHQNYEVCLSVCLSAEQVLKDRNLCGLILSHLKEAKDVVHFLSLNRRLRFYLFPLLAKDIFEMMFKTPINIFKDCGLVLSIDKSVEFVIKKNLSSGSIFEHVRRSLLELFETRQKCSLSNFEILERVVSLCSLYRPDGTSNFLINLSDSQTNFSGCLRIMYAMYLINSKMIDYGLALLHETLVQEEVLDHKIHIWMLSNHVWSFLNLHLNGFVRTFFTRYVNLLEYFDFVVSNMFAELFCRPSVAVSRILFDFIHNLVHRYENDNNGLFFILIETKWYEFVEKILVIDDYKHQQNTNGPVFVFNDYILSCCMIQTMSEYSFNPEIIVHYLTNMDFKHYYGSEILFAAYSNVIGFEKFVRDFLLYLRERKDNRVVLRPGIEVKNCFTTSGFANKRRMFKLNTIFDELEVIKKNVALLELMIKTEDFRFQKIEKEWYEKAMTSYQITLGLLNRASRKGFFDDKHGYPFIDKIPIY